MTNFYAITLDATPERTAHAKAEFEREGVPVTWVYGIDASAFAIRPGLYMHTNPDGQPPYYITPGACALVLSHYMAYRYAERDGCDDFVIFEDDVVLPEGFLEKLEMMKKYIPPKTLAVWLEYCCIEPARCQPAIGSLRYAAPLCTAAVWYKKEAIPICLKAIQPAHAPVDILLQQRAELNQCITDPQMCHQLKYNDTVNSTIHRAIPDKPPGEIS